MSKKVDKVANHVMETKEFLRELEIPATLKRYNPKYLNLVNFLATNIHLCACFLVHQQGCLLALEVHLLVTGEISC